MVYLLGLPPLLDAVIDESHKASCHDNAVIWLVWGLNGESNRVVSDLLGNVSYSIKYGLVLNPHEARWHPAPGGLVSVDLAGRP